MKLGTTVVWREPRNDVGTEIEFSKSEEESLNDSCSKVSLKFVWNGHWTESFSNRGLAAVAQNRGYSCVHIEDSCGRILKCPAFLFPGILRNRCKKTGTMRQVSMVQMRPGKSGKLIWKAGAFWDWNCVLEFRWHRLFSLYFSPKTRFQSQKVTAVHIKFPDFPGLIWTMLTFFMVLS